jgi:HNH endonuclease
MDTELEQAVRLRAADTCEYCQLPQDHYRERFQIDHIISQQHGGPTAEGNLALCCVRCNLHKGPNIAGIDVVSGKVVPLFHPRRDVWSEHFRWDGAVLVGLTPTGRATVHVLNINHPGRIVVRESLISEGVFPP